MTVLEFTLYLSTTMDSDSRIFCEFIPKDADTRQAGVRHMREMTLKDLRVINKKGKTHLVVAINSKSIYISH